MSKGSSLKSNFIFNVSYQILNIMLPLITAPYVSRILGAGMIGVYSYSQAFANYFFLFTMLGVNNYGNRSIAQCRDAPVKMKHTFWNIYTIQFCSSIIVSILYLTYITLFIKQNRLVYYLQIFYVMSGLLDVNWFCFGMEKFRFTAIRSTIVKILSAVLIFIFVNSENDLWIYTLILSSSFLFSGMAIWPYVLKTIGICKPEWSEIKKHIKPNLVLFWPVIAISLYNIMDKLMLGYFSPEKEVAFYTYAEKIIAIPTTIILALDNVIMPRMSNLFATHDTKKTQYLMNYVMMFAMFMSAAMSFGLAGIADIFAPWFYGKGFERCGYFMLLLSPAIIFKGWAGALRTQFIIPTSKDNIYILSLTLGAGVNLILNFILIPVMSGVGAIIGTIAAEFTVCFIQFFLCKKEIQLKNYMMDGLSFCLIGGVMFVVIHSIGGFFTSPLASLIIQVLIGAIFYTIVASFYMIFIRRKPDLINQGLKLLKIKYQFKSVQ